MSLTQINKAGLDEIALDHVFTIGASGSSAYTFQGEGLNGTVNNPTLYLTRGKTYRFENGSGGHPIRIQSTSGASGTAYNTGVTNNAGSGTVIVEVQHDAPDVLYYQCTSHAAMNGILYITGALADGGVTTAKIAADAVDGTKIADNAINSEHYTDGSIDTAHIGDSQITTSKIADNQVITAKINAGAVTTDKIADTAVTMAKLDNSGGIVLPGNIGVQAANMYGNAIATAAIQNSAVTTAKIANDAVTAAKLADNAVVRANISDDAVNADKITAGGVDTNALGSDSVTTVKILNANVTTDKLADNAVTSQKIANDSVTLAKLENGTSSNDGKFLRANNGADPSFETVSTDLVADTSPQLGGDLLQNGNSIVGYNNEKHKFGNSGNMEIYHTGSSGVIKNTDTSTLLLQANQVAILNSPGNSTRAWFGAGNATQLHYNNAEKFATTSYGTKITGYQSTTSSIGFFVRCDGNNLGFGTSSGSSITTYDVDYYSPIPMFASKTVGAGSSYLTFPSYAGGNYIKFTAPVSGVYMFELMCSWETHSGGDWLAMGWEKNTTTSSSSAALSGYGQYASGVFNRTSVDSGGPSHLQTIMYMDTNDYAVLYQQSCQAVRWGSNEAYVRGTLIN